MTFEAAVAKRALQAPDLSPLDGRVDWLRRPGPVLPAMTLQTISDPRPTHFKGWQPRRTRVQADLWGASYAEIIALREAAIVVLAPAAKLDGVIFQRAEVVNVRSGFEQIEAGDDAQPQGELYRESIDFIFTHTPG